MQNSESESKTLLSVLEVAERLNISATWFALPSNQESAMLWFQSNSIRVQPFYFFLSLAVTEMSFAFLNFLSSHK